MLYICTDFFQMPAKGWIVCPQKIHIKNKNIKFSTFIFFCECDLFGEKVFEGITKYNEVILE